MTDTVAQNVVSNDDDPQEVQDAAGAEAQQGASGAADKEKQVQFEIPVSEPVEVTCMEDIVQAIDRHAAWIESVINPRSSIIGGRANFRGADLSGYNLAGVDLRGANFSEALLRGTILSGANLAGANFLQANLQGADLRGAKLKRANFEAADLTDADWDAADFTGAQLVGIKISSDATHPGGQRGGRRSDSADLSPANKAKSDELPAQPSTQEAQSDLR